MKKVLKCLFTLALLVSSAVLLVGCTKQKEELLAKAGDYVYNLYAETVGTKTDSFQVVNKTIIDGEEIAVEWSLDVTKGTQDAISLAKTEDGVYTNVVVGYYDEKVKEETEFSLVPTLTYKKVSKSLVELLGEEKGVLKFNVGVFTIGNRTGWEALASDKTTTINIKGVVLDVVGAGSSSAGSFYFQDSEGFGYYAYKPAGATKTVKDADGKDVTAFNVKAGDVVVVSGTRSDYSGQQEFAQGCTFHVYEGATQDVIVNDASESFKKAADNKSVDAKFQNTYVKIANCKPVSVDGSYYYFEISGGKAQFNIYDSYYFLSDAQRDAFKAAWTEAYENGSTFEIQGISTVYSSAFQVYGSSKFPAIFTVTGTLTAQEKVDAVALQAKAAVEPYIVEDYEVQLPKTFALKGLSATWTVLTETDKAAIDADGKLTVTFAGAPDKIELNAHVTDGTLEKDQKVEIVVVKTIKSVAQFIADANATDVQFLHGTVVAANGTGSAADSFVLGDETGFVFSYNKYQVKLGDEIWIATKFSRNSGLAQSATSRIIKIASAENSFRGEVDKSVAINADNYAATLDAYKTADAMPKESDTDKAARDAALAAVCDPLSGRLMKFTGFFVQSGNYINLYVDEAGATQMCSLYMNADQKTAYASLVGKAVDIYGFVRGVTKNYITVQVQGIVEKDVKYVNSKVWADNETVTCTFASDTTYNTWGSSYSAHTEKFSDIKFIFDGANKQSSGNAIDDCPVTKGKPLTISLTNGDIQSVVLTAKQWGSKAQVISCSYTLDGTNWVALTETSDNFAYTADLSGIEGNVIGVKFTFSSTSNQVGFVSAVVTVNAEK